MNKFEYIRQRNPKVKRGRVVVFRGRPMKISSTHNAHLVLRDEVIVHPKDPDLFYSIEPYIDGALDLLNSAVQRMIWNSSEYWEGYENQYEVISELMRTMVRDITNSYKALPKE